MPIEIRELVIKTTLESHPISHVSPHESASLETFRQEILEQCERLIREYQTKKRLER